MQYILLFFILFFTSGLLGQDLDLPFIKPVVSSHEADIWYWDVQDKVLFKQNGLRDGSAIEYEFKNRRLTSINQFNRTSWLLTDQCWKPTFGNPQGNTFCLIDKLISPQELDNRKEFEWQISGNRVQNRWNIGRFSEWEFSDDFPTYLIVPIVLKLLE